MDAIKQNTDCQWHRLSEGSLQKEKEFHNLCFFFQEAENSLPQKIPEPLLFTHPSQLENSLQKEIHSCQLRSAQLAAVYISMPSSAPRFGVRTDPCPVCLGNEDDEDQTRGCILSCGHVCCEDCFTQLKDP